MRTHRDTIVVITTAIRLFVTAAGLSALVGASANTGEKINS